MKFRLRLAAGHLVVPAVPPLLLMVVMRGSGPMDSGLFFIYYGFGFAAMVVLGLPMLFCCFRLGWTGFVPFMIGAGFAAGLTAYVFGNFATAVMFSIFGMVSGFLYRLLLFGTAS